MGRTHSRFLLDRRAFLSLTAGTAAMALAPPGLARVRRSEDLTALSLHEASLLVRNKEVSPVELTQACLARIEKYDRKINAFITLTKDIALAQASAAEQEIRAGRWRGPLHGIPIALKDNIDTVGTRTTAASALYATRMPGKDAEVVRRLNQAGAVMLGKLNLNEFAAGADGVVTFWGPTRNPWNTDYTTGGSSSGSGAAVAADFCYAALGTDTGGSIRIPASQCGIVGLKPTYGLVSIGGIVPLVESYDHAGPMCKTVLDAALTLQAIAGHDPDWTGSVNVQVPDYPQALRQNFTPPRLGIPRAHFFDKLDPEVAALFEDALRTLRTLASRVTDNVVLSANLEQDKAFFAEILAYHKQFLEERPELYQPSVRKGLLGFYKDQNPTGADYILARKKLETVRRQVPELFKGDFDLLVMPTWKEPAMKIEDRRKQLESTAEEAPALYNTSPFNHLGVPAISVPCGFTKSGLPVGLQIVGAPFAETQVLALAHAYEQATQWHLRKPKLAV